MGTPIDETPPGVLCSTCFGVGKPFESIPTPLYIAFGIFRLEKGNLWTPSDGEPPGGWYTLTQTAVPCVWRYTYGAFLFNVLWTPFNSELFVSYKTTEVFFSILHASLCVRSGLNDLQSPIGKTFYSGDCTIHLGMM